MRVLAILAVLVAPTVAIADAKKFHTTVSVWIEDEQELSDKVGESLHSETGTRLDACWRKETKTQARVVFEKGKVAKVTITQTDDHKADACLSKALRALTIATPSRVIASVETSSLQRDNVGILKDPFAIHGLTSNLGKLNGLSGVTGAGYGPAGYGTGTLHGGTTTTANAAKFTAAANADVDVKSDAELSAEQINRVVRARAGVFRACYEKELTRDPKVAGKLVLKFTIEPDGTVSATTVTSTTLKSSAVESCTKANVLRMKFPATSSSTTVRYPFVFTH